MKKVFGIADSKNAYFYELECSDQFNEIIAELNSRLNIQKEDIVLCDFYDNTTHNYGKYQNDINNGYASVLDVHTMHIDKRTTGLSRINSNPRFGVVELTIVYQSQISKVIKNTFEDDKYVEKYKPIDFTDMIRVVNSIDNIPNTFTYDAVVDKRFKYMNTSFNYSLNTNAVNEKLYLNEKDKGMSLDEYYDVISKISDNISLKLIAIYDMEKTYNEEIENMKRYATRNYKLVEMPIFNPILRKLPITLIKDEVFTKKVSTKKYEYKDKYNVYLQKDSIHGIM